MSIVKNPVLNVKNEARELAIQLETVKNFLKVDYENDDELINKLIKTSTNQCETYINKSLIEKNYVYSIYDLKSTSLILPYSPIKSIEEIVSVKSNNNNIILKNDEYFLDNIGGIINFKNKLSNFYRIDIDYIAGVDFINDELIQALLMHIARMYEDRSGYSPIPLNSLNIYKKYKQIKL